MSIIDPDIILNRPNLINLREYNRVIPSSESDKVWLQLTANFQVDRVITDELDADAWMRGLVASIDMDIAKGPISWNCTDLGNEGMSSMVMITTSTATMHFWGNHLMLDVFSCKHFEVSSVMNYVKKTLGIERTRLLFLYDRSVPPFPQIPLHVVYKTTNLVNGKIYIGVHSSYLFMDDYLGSGVLLKKAIRKYGKESFKNEILNIFTNADEAYEYEKSIVNDEFIGRNDVYNIAVGGRHPTKTFKQIDEESEVNRGRKWIKNTDGECRFTIDHENMVMTSDWTYGRVFTEQALENIKIYNSSSVAKDIARRPGEKLRGKASSLKGRESPLKGRKFANEDKKKRYPIKHLFIFASPDGNIIEVSSSLLTAAAQDLGLRKWALHTLAYTGDPGDISCGWTFIEKRAII